jgi:hypothetical protein
VWCTEADEDVIEANIISGMGHGVPLSTRRGPDRCGNAGPFHFDVGISSSHHIVRFWGLAESHAAFEEKGTDHAQAHLVPIVVPASATSLIAAREDVSSGGTFPHRDGPSDSHAEIHAGAADAHDPRVIITAALKAAGVLSAGEPGGDRGNSNPLDPGRVITATLRSVGLLKE